MIRLVLGLDELVIKWVRAQLPGTLDFGPATAIGVADGTRLIAGVVYSNYHGHMIEVSVASTDRRWVSRNILRGLFAYPWQQLGVGRMQVTIAKRDKHTRKFVERLGFRYEGTGRKAWPDGSDACIYSLLRHEAERWLKEKPSE